MQKDLDLDGVIDKDVTFETINTFSETFTFTTEVMGFYLDDIFSNKYFPEGSIKELKICPKLKDRLLYHDYLADKAQTRSKEFLEHVKIGEIVYCTTEMEDVIFLNKPKNKFDWCQYKTFAGKIREARAHCFRKISHGNKYAEYRADQIDDLNASGILAREYGFRVEKITLKNSYLLRIYGGTQEDVDQFVISLKNNYFIY